MNKERIQNILDDVDPLSSVGHNEGIYEKVSENIDKFIKVCNSHPSDQVIGARIQILLTVESGGIIPKLSECTRIASLINENDM